MLRDFVSRPFLLLLTLAALVVSVLEWLVSAAILDLLRWRRPDADPPPPMVTPALMGWFEILVAMATEPLRRED